MSCGLSCPKLSKTTAAPAFHLAKFEDNFGNTLFSLWNSLGLCSSLVQLLFSVSVFYSSSVATPPYPHPTPMPPFSHHPFLSFLRKSSLCLVQPPGCIFFEVLHCGLWSLAITTGPNLFPGNSLFRVQLNKFISSLLRRVWGVEVVGRDHAKAQTSSISSNTKTCSVFFKLGPPAPSYSTSKVFPQTSLPTGGF